MEEIKTDFCVNCGREYNVHFLINRVCRECLEKRKEKEKKDAELLSAKNNAIKSIIPKRYIHVDLNNYITSNDKQKRIIQQIKNYCDNGLKNGANLVLSGNIGTGKTHLSLAVAKEKIMQQTEISGLDFIISESAKYTTISEIIMSVRQAMSYGGDKREINTYYKTELLIIDEIGRQSGSENEKNILFEVLNKRYNNVLPTILISNKSGAEIEGYLGSALVDRMIETGSIFINLDWDSYRQK